MKKNDEDGLLLQLIMLLLLNTSNNAFTRIASTPLRWVMFVVLK